MKISALITNFNYARFLPAAVESVLAQTHADIEAVIVDDGSTDESGSVIRRLVDTSGGRVKAIFQRNGGQAAAFNAGLAHCSGEVVAFLDADDVWRPTKAARIAEAMDDVNVGFLMHSLGHIDVNGARIGKVLCVALPDGDLRPLLVATGGANQFPPTSAMAVRRNVLESYFPLPAEDWRLCADGAIAFAAAVLTQAKVLNEVLADYRLHGTNRYWQSGHSATAGAKSRRGVEMTNRYLNDLVQRFNRGDRIDLNLNLYYRRDRFYAGENLGMNEFIDVCRLIVHWPLYTAMERAKFLSRFLAKAAIVMRPRWSACSVST